MSTPLVDVIRLGPATKIRLTTLKRRTGIENWNVLCRWAFSLSIADPEPVTHRYDEHGNAVEMTWKTFSGEQDWLYSALLQQRAEIDKDVYESGSLGSLLRCHIARGIGRLVAVRVTDSIESFIEKGSPAKGGDMPP